MDGCGGDPEGDEEGGGKRKSDARGESGGRSEALAGIYFIRVRWKGRGRGEGEAGALGGEGEEGADAEDGAVGNPDEIEASHDVDEGAMPAFLKAASGVDGETGEEPAAENDGAHYPGQDTEDDGGREGGMRVRGRGGGGGGVNGGRGEVRLGEKGEDNEENHMEEEETDRDDADAAGDVIGPGEKAKALAGEDGLFVRRGNGWRGHETDELYQEEDRENSGNGRTSERKLGLDEKGKRAESGGRKNRRIAVVYLYK